MTSQTTKYLGTPSKPRVTRLLKNPATKKPAAKRPSAKKAAAGQIYKVGKAGPNKPTARGGHRRILNFTFVAGMPKLDLVDLIREGVPPNDFKEMVKRMGVPQEKVVKFLGVSTATINRRSLRNENLSPDESARVVGLASLIGQVQTMVERSGDPEGFDAAKWVSNWLEQPIPLLAGRKPAELMDTPPGQEIVSNLVAMMETGAYA